MSKATKKSLYSSDVYQDCLNRIGQLTPGSKPQWGTMTAAQMLSHCAEIQEVSNGKELRGTPVVVKLFKGMIRNMVVGDKPFPKNTKTHPQYRQTSDRDFEAEKIRLIEALDEFVNVDEAHAVGLKHPLFGSLTAEEKGWAMYKHLDHHLRQFGL
jgi:hypothetical protein